MGRSKANDAWSPDVTSLSPPRVQFTPTHGILSAATTPPQQAIAQYSGTGGFGNSPRRTSVESAPLLFAASPPADMFIFNFEPPQLTEETLLEKEHNQALAKLNFVLALVECILELAKAKGVPFSNSIQDSHVSRIEESPGKSGILKSEQLLLYIRCLHLLSSALRLAKDDLEEGKLRPSAAVKQVVTQLNERFKSSFAATKKLHSSATQNFITQHQEINADKMLYNYAIDMCQAAALDELFGNPADCSRQYQTAQILLHSLCQQVGSEGDKQLLLKYKEAVEKRLFVLQQQGYVTASFDDNFGDTTFIQGTK